LEGCLVSKISIIQASMLYKVTNRTIYNWIEQDGIECKNGLYEIDALQKAFDKRRKSKPRLKWIR